MRPRLTNLFQAGNSAAPLPIFRAKPGQPGDSLQGVSVAGTEMDAFGQRTATSAVVGAVFTPADNLALLGWWDTDDAATIFQSGGVVSGWVDKAGGVPLDQCNTLCRPTTRARMINGRDAIDFNGSQFLERTGGLPVSGDVAFHLVVEIDGTENAFEAILAVEATNNFQHDANSDTSFNGRRNMAGSGSTPT